MVNKILNTAGLPYKEARFLQPPEETYAVYLDDVETDGPDGMPRIFKHDVRIELYAPKPDPGAESLVEAAITGAGLQWVKGGRTWLRETQRYLTTYDIEYVIKI